MKKKSDTQIGDEREEKFRDMRISQGYLSQKRNRAKFKKNDLWLFDVISMNKDGIEFAQVKGKEGRGAAKRIKEWIEENRDKIPKNVRFTMAYYTEELGTFRTVDIPKSPDTNKCPACKGSCTEPHPHNPCYWCRGTGQIPKPLERK